MCLQDWIIGSRMRVQVREVALTPASTSFISQSANRVLVVVSGHPTTTVLWRPINDQGSGESFRFSTSEAKPMTFTLRDHGTMVQNAWWGSSLANVTVVIAEGFLPDDLMDKIRNGQL